MSAPAAPSTPEVKAPVTAAPDAKKPATPAAPPAATPAAAPSAPAPAPDAKVNTNIASKNAAPEPAKAGEVKHGEQEGNPEVKKDEGKAASQAEAQRYAIKPAFKNK